MADKVRGLAVKLSFLLQLPAHAAPGQVCPGEPWVLLPVCAAAAVISSCEHCEYSPGVVCDEHPGSRGSFPPGATLDRATARL